MLKYEYVTVDVNYKVLTAEYTEHREIIDGYAQKGYRYVGFIPVSITHHGLLRKIDLIFEKL